MSNQIILMSGYPASGKSTLARALAQRLGFALVSKDAILATLFEALEFTPGDAAASVRAGQAAWAIFWMQARLSPRVVLDTNLRPGSAHECQQLATLQGRIVEVHCECPPELAQQRYAQRATSGHPAQRFRELTAARLAEYEGEIGVGRRVVVDTSDPTDVDAVAMAVACQL